jgi:hypothetical protein
MPNAWVEHVKKYAKDNNISYGCAISKAKDTYVKKEKPKAKPKAKPKKQLQKLDVKIKKAKEPQKAESIKLEKPRTMRARKKAEGLEQEFKQHREERKAVIKAQIEDIKSKLIKGVRRIRRQELLKQMEDLKEEFERIDTPIFI